MTPMAFSTKEVNPWLTKRPLKTNGHLANRALTSLVKEATGRMPSRAMGIGSHTLNPIGIGRGIVQNK